MEIATRNGIFPGSGTVIVKSFLTRRWQCRGEIFLVYASWAGGAGEGGGGLLSVFSGLSTVFRTVFRRGFKTCGGLWGKFGIFLKSGVVYVEFSARFRTPRQSLWKVFICVAGSLTVKGSQCSRPGRVGLDLAFLGLPMVFRTGFYWVRVTCANPNSDRLNRNHGRSEEI